MSNKTLIFFQIYANNSANCANDASKNDVINQSPVKTECPIKNWKHQKGKNCEEKSNQKTAKKPRLFVFFHSNKNPKKDGNTFDDLIDRRNDRIGNGCETQNKSKNQNSKKCRCKPNCHSFQNASPNASTFFLCFKCFHFHYCLLFAKQTKFFWYIICGQVLQNDKWNCF